jgi:hypothetical protein
VEDDFCGFKEMLKISKKDILDYLLGRNSGTREDEFLAACFSSDENVELYECTRDDLVESYLRKELSEDSRKRFEEHFLADPSNRELLDFATELRETLRGRPFVGDAAAKAAERRPALGGWLAPALAFASLLVAVFVFWQFSQTEQKDLAKTGPEPVVTQKKQEPAQTPPTNMESKPTLIETPNPITPSAPDTPIPTSRPGKAVLAYMVPLGIQKGGESDALKIGPETAKVKLITPKPKKIDGNSVEFTIRVEEENGDKVWVSPPYKELPLNSEGRVEVTIWARQFKAGRLVFKILGKNAEGVSSEVEGTKRIFDVVKR